MNRLKSAACILLWAALHCRRGSAGARRELSVAADSSDHAVRSRAASSISPAACWRRSSAMSWSRPIVPENKPGAGGIVGVDYVAHSEPDGYNIVLMDPGIVINPTLQKSMPYDIFKDLVTVSIVSSSPEVLVVAPQLGIKTYAELVAYGKANPGKLNYASAGVGTTPHLAAEMWKSRTGIDAVHVPYKGIGASFTDMMSNKVQMAFSSIAGALPFTSDNRVIPLATTGTTRSPVYPDLPTVAEAGLPGYASRSLARHYGRAPECRLTCSRNSTLRSTRRCRTRN